jgi:hypothetical protein
MDLLSRSGGGARRRPGRGWARSLAAVLLAVLAGAVAVASEPPVSREYQVKAAFLLNFLQFVEWPATAFETPEEPVRIGILGDDPFGRAMERTVLGETVRGHPLVVRRSTDPAGLNDCHLVFVARSERERLDRVLTELSRFPILTVGDTEGFARRGGVINFLLEDKKVRFEINPLAAKRQNLQPSAQLLNLGRIVEPDGHEGD